MNGKHESTVKMEGNVPCNVAAILNEHDVPCTAMSQIPFDAACLQKMCVKPIDPKAPEIKASL